jgi:hypothetical protein
MLPWFDDLPHKALRSLENKRGAPQVTTIPLARGLLAEQQTRQSTVDVGIAEA